MERYSLLAGLVLISANVFGMQNHPAFDGRYFGLGLTLNDLRVSIKHDKSSDAFNDHFMKAVQKNDIETVKKFLKDIRTQTECINKQDKDGHTPLMWAVRNGNQEIVELLLECRDIKADMKNKDGNNAQDFAIMKGYVDILKKPEAEEFTKLYYENINVMEILFKKQQVPSGKVFPVRFHPGYLSGNGYYLDVLLKYSNFVDMIEKRNCNLEGLKYILNDKESFDVQHLWKVVLEWYNNPTLK